MLRSWYLTYEGLAFPTLAWADNQSLDWLNTSNLITQAVVPALESGLTCYQCNESEITAETKFVDPDREPKLGDPNWPAGNRILVNITGQYCRSEYYNGTASDSSATAVFFINDTMPSGGVFATGTTSFFTPQTIFQACNSQSLYIWGSFSGDDTHRVSICSYLQRIDICY
ncbi:hypothetical protein ANO14919_045730 [Xylariales sp. No.14919]|nr:hypothetical protein ANO14919_045730 [Xylariales sp. No.14919]